MNTKRVNNEFHRLDIKLPIDVYEQISKIAVNSFSARVHHISGKPEISPTLIYLLELGIQSFLNGSELIKKYDTDKFTDSIPISEKGVKTLIKDELIPIQSKLDELSEIVNRLTYTDNKPIGVENIAVAMTERILENISDKYTDNELVEIENITDNDTNTITDKIEIETDNSTDNNTDNRLIDLSESLNLPLKEDEGQIVPIEKEKPNIVDISSLIEKYGIKEGAIELKEDKEKLALLIGEVLGKKVGDVSRVAKGEKGFIAPDIFWLYFSAEKKGNKWLWTLTHSVGT